MTQPHCPTCSAAISSRKFTHCTTCGAVLPPENIMTPEQVQKVADLDAHTRKLHEASLKWMGEMRDKDIRLGGGYG